jgi:ATP synthase protein I
MSEQPTDKEGNKSSLKDFLVRPVIKADSKALQYSSIGITLVGTILIFLWIGMWLDGKFETSPWFTLILTFVGFAGGFYSFYLNIKKMNSEDKKENPKFNKY